MLYKGVSSKTTFRTRDILRDSYHCHDPRGSVTSEATQELIFDKAH